MQYTGLTDRENIPIFEGDIVQIAGHAFEGSIAIDGKYIVSYNENMELCCGGWLLYRQLPYVNVIGNKYEDKHHLEGIK
mgnify:CR=1 FL=1